MRTDSRLGIVTPQFVAPSSIRLPSKLARSRSLRVSVGATKLVWMREGNTGCTQFNSLI